MYKSVKTWTEDKPWLATSRLLVTQVADETLKTMFRAESPATRAWRTLVAETCGPLASVIIKTAQDKYREAALAFKKKGNLGGRKGFCGIETIEKTLHRDPNATVEDEAVASLIETVDRTVDAILCELFKRINEIHPLVGESLHAMVEHADADKGEIGFKNLFFLRFVNVVLIAPETFNVNVVGTDLKIMRDFNEESFKMFLCAVTKEIVSCCCNKFTTEPMTDKQDRWKLPVLLFMQKVEDRQTWLKSKRPTVDLRSIVSLTGAPRKSASMPSLATRSGSRIKNDKGDREHTEGYSAVPLKTADHLPEGKRLRDLDCLELCKVLYSLRLYELIQKIYDEGVTGDAIRTMDAEALKNLGVTKRFHRERIVDLQRC